METTTRPRRWGNSLGITIPKEIVEKEGITLRDELVVDIRKKRNKEAVKKMFGRFAFRKSAQEIKNEMWKGWE